MPLSTVKDCLAAIDVDPSVLQPADGLEAEWAIIKKAYFKKILAAHPDKGGDPAVFRNVQTAFEVLRLVERFDIEPYSDFSAK